MTLDYNWINLLILFGAIQGLIFSIILLLNKTHPGARYLSLFMFVLAFNGFETFSWSSGLDNYISFFDFSGYITIYALGPSLYLYIKSLLYPERKHSSKHVLGHYVPALFQFTVSAVVAILYFLYTLQLFDQGYIIQGIYDVHSFYSEPLSVILFLTYLVISYRMFRKASTGHNIIYISRDGQKVVYKWIKTLLIFLVILGVTWPLTVLAPVIFDLPYNVHYYPIELTLVLFIYWVAFVGYHKMKMIYIQIPSQVKSSELPINSDELLYQLKQAMEYDKIYLDSALNRDKVSEHTGINPKMISQVLNQHAGMSFNDFVNQYRVNEVCDNLLSNKHKHLTISGIALASGFNSQATFQRAFKSVKGLSPKEYLALELKKMG